VSDTKCALSQFVRSQYELLSPFTLSHGLVASNEASLVERHTRSELITELLHYIYIYRYIYIVYLYIHYIFLPGSRSSSGLTTIQRLPWLSSIEVMFIKIKSRQVSLHRVFTKSVFFSIGEGVLEGGCTHMLHRRVLHGAMALVTTNFAQHARTRDSRGGAAVARNRAAINKTGVSKGVRGKRGGGVRGPGRWRFFFRAHRRTGGCWG